jgi:hypothetical protein
VFGKPFLQKKKKKKKKNWYNFVWPIVLKKISLFTRIDLLENLQQTHFTNTTQKKKKPEYTHIYIL